MSAIERKINTMEKESKHSKMGLFTKGNIMREQRKEREKLYLPISLIMLGGLRRIILMGLEFISEGMERGMRASEGRIK